MKYALVWLFLAFVPLSLKAGEVKWYRGNTHTHTLWSDGDDLPESVAHWYKDNGYEFLVLSDHNILSRGEFWEELRADEAIPVLERAAALWGKDHVKTRVHEGKKQIRLMPLEEVRAMLEEPGQFILIEGLEMTTTRSGGLAVHTNPMNVSALLPVVRNSDRSVSQELTVHADLVQAHSEETGKSIFWQVNHPNFRFSVTSEHLAEAHRVDGVEIMNSSSNCFNLGDGTRPSVERIWDIANTVRLKREGVAPIYGTATDDTHDYHQENPAVNGPGTSWVMVRSEALTSDAITQAMRDGSFYSTTGVLLETLDYDSDARRLSIKVDAEEGVNYSIEFIGSLKDVSLANEHLPAVVDEKGIVHPVSPNYVDDGIGTTFQKTEGTQAVYQMTGDELYVRAVVHSDATPYFRYDDYSELEKKAWTQPVGWVLER